MKYKYWIYPVSDFTETILDSFNRRPDWKQLYLGKYNTPRLLKLLDNDWNLIWKQLDDINLTDGVNVTNVNFYDVGRDGARQDQIANHSPISKLITEKDNLITTLTKYYKKYNIKIFDVMSESLLVDSENVNTIEDFVKEDTMYIVKPAEMNAGLGIRVFDNKKDTVEHVYKGVKKEIVVYDYTRTHYNPEKQNIRLDERWVIQKYISNPLLMEGRKFDMRVNTIITDDYDIYFGNEIFVRTSSLPYVKHTLENNEANLATHVTNNSFQKKIPELYGIYEEANVLSTDQLQNYFDLSYGKDVVNIRRDFFPRWKEIIIDVFMSIREDIKERKSQRRFYEIIGFDFMIDENFKTWLIEANQNPQLGWGTKWSYEYLPFFTEEVFKKAIDPYFPVKKIYPLKKKYPDIPKTLPWSDKVTPKALPSWFVPNTEKVPVKKQGIFELIYSEKVPINKISHQMHNSQTCIEENKSNTNPYRFMCERTKEFYYPFKTFSFRSKSPKRSRSKSVKRSKSSVKSK